MAGGPGPLGRMGPILHLALSHLPPAGLPCLPCCAGPQTPFQWVGVLLIFQLDELKILPSSF